MKTLIQIIAGIIMPNLFLAYIINNSIKHYEFEDEIKSKDDIKFLYFMACLIVLVPICLYTYFYFNEVNQYQDSTFLLYLSFTASASLYAGIVISLIYLSSSTSLDPVKK